MEHNNPRMGCTLFFCLRQALQPRLDGTPGMT